MSRKDELDILYTSPPMDRNLAIFESIPIPCRIYNLLSNQDIYNLHKIATSRKLSSEPIQKFKMIKDIMEARGFKRLSAGTNRVVYKYMEDQRFVIKIAYDYVGLSDNLNELYNQNILKPFCAKVFEVTPDGVVGLFERVKPITNREQFAQISVDVFDIIINRFLGKYILADFGSKFFMNWGVRKNAHPVILDFPYVYELDGAKLYCNRPDMTTESGFCGGEIDYDDGFNNLRCTKCGKTFLASELKLAFENKNSDIIISQEDMNMIVNIYRGEKLIHSEDTSKQTTTYKKDKFGRRKETPLEYRQRKKRNQFQLDVVIERGTVEVKKEDKKSHYVVIPDEETVEDNRPKYNPSDFNNRMTLNQVPSIDDIYKNFEIDVIGSDGTVIKSTRRREPEQETIRVETMIDISRRAMELRYDDTTYDNIVPEEHESTNEEVSTVDELDQDSEEIVTDIGEQEEVVTEETSKLEEEDDSNEDGEKSIDPHKVVNIIIEPRGDDLPKKEFNNNRQQVDPAFYE